MVVTRSTGPRTLYADLEQARQSLCAAGLAFPLMAKPDSGFDAMDPANVSPLVVWLASPLARHITGRVFEVEGGVISVADGWRHGPRADKGARWDPAEIGPVVDKLIAAGPLPDPVYGAPR